MPVAFCMEYSCVELTSPALSEPKLILCTVPMQAETAGLGLQSRMFGIPCHGGPAKPTLSSWMPASRHGRLQAAPQEGMILVMHCFV